MSKLSNVLRSLAVGRVGFWCPGCDNVHAISVAPAPSPWEWDGNVEAPTFSPSILVRGGSENTTCHSFVKAGQIQFLSDCTHALVGQTVPLPDWPAHFHDGNEGTTSEETHE